MNELTVSTSRWKATLLLLMCLGFVCGAGLMFIYDQEEPWIGGVGVVLFGGLFLLSLRYVTDTKPRLIITKKGIEFPRWNIGQIPWADINAVTIARIQKTKYLALHLKDEEKYLRKLTPFKQRMVALNRMTRIPPFSVPMGLMTVSNQTILDTAKFFHAESLRG